MYIGNPEFELILLLTFCPYRTFPLVPILHVCIFFFEPLLPIHQHFYSFVQSNNTYKIVPKLLCHINIGNKPTNKSLSFYFVCSFPNSPLFPPVENIKVIYSVQESLVLILPFFQCGYVIHLKCVWLHLIFFILSFSFFHSC